MRKSLALVVVVAMLVSVVGCQQYSVPVQPQVSWIVMDVRRPLSADNQGVKLPVANEKVGRATTKQYVGIVTSGDGSIEAAAKAGGITNISYVDYEYFSVLGAVYSEFTIVVHGN
jgi:hypothetical protein